MRGVQTFGLLTIFLHSLRLFPQRSFSQDSKLHISKEQSCVHYVYTFHRAKQTTDLPNRFYCWKDVVGKFSISKLRQLQYAFVQQSSIDLVELNLAETSPGHTPKLSLSQRLVGLTLSRSLLVNDSPCQDLKNLYLLTKFPTLHFFIKILQNCIPTERSCVFTDPAEPNTCPIQLVFSAGRTFKVIIFLFLQVNNLGLRLLHSLLV